MATKKYFKRNHCLIVVVQFPTQPGKQDISVIFDSGDICGLNIEIFVADTGQRQWQRQRNVSIFGTLGQAERIADADTPFLIAVKRPVVLISISEYRLQMFVGIFEAHGIKGMPVAVGIVKGFAQPCSPRFFIVVVNFSLSYNTKAITKHVLLIRHNLLNVRL